MVSFSPVWILSWILRVVQREGLVAVLTDELLHAQVDALVLLEVAVHGSTGRRVLHWYGFSPVWHRMCILRWRGSETA